MPSTPEEKKKVLARIRRLKGQLNSLEQALENEVECYAILQQIAAVRGATNGLMAQILASHLTETFSEPIVNEAMRQHIDDVIELIRTYLK